MAAHLEHCSRCLRVLQSPGGGAADPLVAGLRRCSSTAPRTEDEDRGAVALVELLADSYATAMPSPHPTRAPEPIGAHERLGPYELLEPLGQGGMGSVYKARHVHLGKVVALKLLPPERLASPAARARFLQEMQAVGRLEHPHIVQAFDAAVDEVPYLAMEHVAGTDLAKLVDRGGPLPVADACELVRQAALGLQHAHENGLVHRDVKPSNLMLTTGGRVKVLDLGLARIQAGEAGSAALTATGALMGTPDYMPPEQLLDSHAVDIRADVYSLGCTLYHLLAGRPPFGDEQHGDLASKRKAHLSEPLPSLRTLRAEVPVALAAVLERLTAKEPADRFATPAEVAAALETFTAGCRPEALLGPVSPAVPPAASTAPAGMHRTTGAAGQPAPRRWRWLAAALAGVGLLFLAAWGAGRLGPSQAAPLRLLHFEVRHYRQEADRALALPPVGGAGFTGARFNDRVRVAAELSEPAHCYLRAFNPDGRDQLCLPSHDQAAPLPAKDLLYPQGDALFRLNDGVGLQAFVLLASRRPLPPYATWRQRLGPLPWTRADGNGVWRYNGGSFHPLESPRRGQEEKLPVPPAFAELCRHLQQHGGAELLEAILILVQPK
jgi:hypothetical protein